MHKPEDFDPDVPRHDEIFADAESIRAVDPDGPGAAPPEAYEVLPDGEHPYRGDDAPDAETLRGLTTY